MEYNKQHTKETISCTIIAFIAMSPLLSLSAGQDHTHSIYTEKFNDSNAVYLNQEQFDVTADGMGDDAPALQAAIDHVLKQSRNGIVFIPEGTYRLGNTIRLWSGIRLIGYGANRPTFTLGDNTPGFQEGENKYMVHFCQGPGDIEVSQPGTWRTSEFVDGTWSTFYSGINNINFKIGEGNPAAIAVRYHIAQGCMLQNIHFNVGSGRGGVEDMGNMIENCTFSGGEWGINTKSSPPDWQCMLLDCKFEDQRQASLITNGARMLVIRGRFTNSPVGILVPGQEKLYVKDTVFKNIKTSALVFRNFVSPELQVNLDNVKLSNVPFSSKFSGRTQGWSKNEVKFSYEAEAPIYAVESFSHGLHVEVPSSEQFPVEFATKIKQSPIDSLGEFTPDDMGKLPPQTSWVNIADLGAKGDGETDCTAIFENAILKYDTIYVPMGKYVISRTITLRDRTMLVGLHPSRTVLIVKDDTPGFTDPENRKPLLVSSKGKTNGISGIGFNLGHNPGIIGIKWMAGRHSFIEDGHFFGDHGHTDSFGKGQSCTLWITEGGAGIFKNIWIHDTRTRLPLYISDTKSPGKIYQISVEHHKELEVKIDNVENWSFYALQLEEDRGCEETLGMYIKDSRNLLFANFISHRTTGVWKPCHTAIQIRNSHEISICGNEMRGGVFPFENAVYDEITGNTVPYRIFAKLTMNPNTSD
ncbi:MAG: hypothetical protein FVQ79_06945 [Planctomycetes bacterium]|nr:hypothetical protein [Planctomycetota bacterium]